jgi:hypothetical protein
MERLRQLIPEVHRCSLWRVLGIYVVASWGVLITNFPLAAQTISGMLLGSDSNQPIELGFIVMLTESGDSVAVTITNENGFFSVTSPEPGSFLLHASALGYRESVDGVFDIGADGVMQIEFRLEPRAVTLEGLVVQAERVAKEPKLVSTGFYNRLQRGLGRFITPGDIDESVALATADLFRGIPGVSVNYGPGGDIVTMIGATGWCTPTMYMDGVRVVGGAIDLIAPLETVYAIEVYRRTVEIPIQYSAVRMGSAGSCGVILIWSRR